MDVSGIGPMTRPALTINKTQSALGGRLETEEVELQIRGHELSLDKTPREVELITTYPEINIDLTQSQIERGNHTSESLRRESYQEAKQSILDYIAKKARQGSELARIEEEGNPLIEQPVQDAIREVDYTIDSVPNTPPQMDVIPGEVRLNMSPKEVRANTVERIKDMYFQQMRIDTYLMTKPNLDIVVN